MAITLDTLDASLHSIAISDGTNTLAVDGSGNITVNAAGGSFAVTATDLDIRDLDSAQDSVEIKTAAGQALAIDASGFLTANINGSVTVSATDLDIRDLTHASDSVKIGDGTDFLAINSDGSLNVQSSEDSYDIWQTSTLSASSTAAEIAATPLSNRLRMIIQNLGSRDVFLGEDNTVTTSSGVKLPKGASMEMKYGETANIWAITASGSADLRIAEYAA